MKIINAFRRILVTEQERYLWGPSAQGPMEPPRKAIAISRDPAYFNLVRDYLAQD